MDNLPDDDDSGDEVDDKETKSQFGTTGGSNGSFGTVLAAGSSGHDLDGIPMGVADEDLDLDDLQKSEDLDGIPLSKDGGHVAMSNESSPGTNNTDCK